MITTGGFDRARSHGATDADLAMVAEIVVAGEQSVDWGTALRALRSTARWRPARGGWPHHQRPTARGRLRRRALPHRLPQLVAGDALRILSGLHMDAPPPHDLDRRLPRGLTTFLRYLRARTKADHATRSTG